MNGSLIGLASLHDNRNRWHDAMGRASALAKEWAQRSADSALDGPTYAALHARLAVRYARLVRATNRLIAEFMDAPPLPAGPCPDGLYRADSGEIVRIHHGRPEPAF